jgi:hypothetical protein
LLAGVAGNGNAVGHLANLLGELSDDPAGAVVGLARAFREHRAAFLVDNVDVDSLHRFGDDDVLGEFRELRQFLQSLTERGGGECELAIARISLRARHRVK